MYAKTGIENFFIIEPAGILVKDGSAPDSEFRQQKTASETDAVFVLALPIFPGSHPPSIVGACELNFCVRDGNRWTLTAINTNSFGWLFTISYVKSPSASNSFRIIAPFLLLVNSFLRSW